MKANWLWDSRLNENQVRKVLNKGDHPKFDIYAEKLLSRINDPKIAFCIIDKVIFCKKWPKIKSRMRKNAWLRDRVFFWQTVYERVYQQLKAGGVRIREPQEQRVTPVRMKLAEQIKRLRKKSGYTQRDMAEKMGVIQQYISKIERGYENVSIDTLQRIAKALNKELMLKLK